VAIQLEFLQLTLSFLLLVGSSLSRIRTGIGKLRLSSLICGGHFLPFANVRVFNISKSEVIL